MRLHYLQHVPFEGLGSIETWAKEVGAAITCTQLFNDEQLPRPEDFDWLVVMGGPMNIYEDELYQWLRREKLFIKKAISQGKTVLGVCLGAQLIADVLGAKVSANAEKEIGWFPIQPAGDLPDRRLAGIFPPGLKVMHWHGDTFSLPNQAARLASSEACLNQGFIYQDRVVALQFHLETTRESLSNLIANCRAEIIAAPYIQSEEEMLADDARFAKINKVMSELLTYLKGKYV